MHARTFLSASAKSCGCWVRLPSWKVARGTVSAKLGSCARFLEGCRKDELQDQEDLVHTLHIQQNIRTYVHTRTAATARKPLYNKQCALYPSLSGVSILSSTLTPTAHNTPTHAYTHVDMAASVRWDAATNKCVTGYCMCAGLPQQKLAKLERCSVTAYTGSDMEQCRVTCVQQNNTD